MYEIPPSVDRYLRISSRSMIHFPSVSLESSLSSSIGEESGEETTRLSPKKILFGQLESSAVASGKYFSKEEASRKRGCDQCDKDFQIPSKKVNHEEESSIDCTGIDAYCTAQRIQPTDTTADLHAVHKPIVTNEHIVHDTRGFTRRLPDIKPKVTVSDGYKVEETAWHLNNGRATVRKNPWGPQSYSELISGAISSSPGHRASLQQIYDWIVTNIPWFQDKADYPSTKGWKNAIRHTLSIRKRFTRIVNDRSPHSSLWTFSRHGYRTMAKY